MSGFDIQASLVAGAGQVDIVPKAGTHMGTPGSYVPAQWVADPIRAKALVLESCDTRICILTFDVRAVNTECARRARELAAARFGFDPRMVMVHATQSHAAPPVGHHLLPSPSRYIPAGYEWLRGGDEEYAATAVERGLEAIGLALAARQPAWAWVGSGLEAKVASNRRYVMRDGTVRDMGVASGDPNILHLEGPMDPELGVVCFTSAGARPLSMLLYHTCNCFHGLGEGNITADWPGTWSAEMVRTFGAGCTPLVLKGCCGDVQHRNRLDPDPKHGVDYHLLGHILAETSLDVLRNRMTFQDGRVLECRDRVIKLPVRLPAAREVTAARQMLADYPEPKWLNESHTRVDPAWVSAVGTLQVVEEGEQTPEFDYEIQAMRIGDTAILGLSGQPYVECQLRIKLGSPAFRTFVVHMANVWAGRIPTRAAHEKGLIEARVASLNKLAPEALDLIVDASVKLLGEMFSGKPRVD